MKYFTLIQKITLCALSVIVVVLAVIAFTTAGSLSRNDPNATPQVVVIELANTPTPSPVPIPVPDELKVNFPSLYPSASPAGTTAELPVVTPSAAPTEAAGLPTTKPTGTPVSVPKSAAFVLTIKGKNVEVAGDVGEDTLESGPGWLNTSAAPGQEGICVVYGHRNRNHLKMLEKADYGDTITVTAKDGTRYTYQIESLEIIKADAELRIPTLEGKHLMLVTCYPFYYTGHAPEKYIVLATLQV